MNTGSPERAIPASYTHTFSLGLDALRPSNPKHKISKAFMCFFAFWFRRISTVHCTVSLTDKVHSYGFFQFTRATPCKAFKGSRCHPS